MAIMGEFTACDEIPIGEENGTLLLISTYSHFEAEHYVRSVVKIGDPPKARGFTLCAVHALGYIKALEAFVGFGMYAIANL